MTLKIVSVAFLFGWYGVRFYHIKTLLIILSFQFRTIVSHLWCSQDTSSLLLYCKFHEVVLYKDAMGALKFLIVYWCEPPFSPGPPFFLSVMLLWVQQWPLGLFMGSDSVSLIHALSPVPPQCLSFPCWTGLPPTHWYLTIWRDWLVAISLLMIFYLFLSIIPFLCFNF